MTVHTVACPSCETTFDVELLRQGEHCGAPYPVADERLCHLEEHAADEHDPEHETTGPTGAVVRWRESEFS